MQSLLRYPWPKWNIPSLVGSHCLRSEWRLALKGSRAGFLGSVWFPVTWLEVLFKDRISLFPLDEQIQREGKGFQPQTYVCTFPDSLGLACCPAWRADDNEALSDLLGESPKVLGFDTNSIRQWQILAETHQENRKAAGCPEKAEIDFCKVGLMNSSPWPSMALPEGSCKTLKGCVNTGAGNRFTFGTGTLLSVKPSTWVVRLVG